VEHTPTAYLMMSFVKREQWEPARVAFIAGQHHTVICCWECLELQPAFLPKLKWCSPH